MATILIAGEAGALKRALQLRGHEVVVIDSFAGAFGYVERDVDLLVVAADLGAGPTGFELLARFRRLRDAARLPALAICAADEEAILRGYAAGASDCVTQDTALPVMLAKCEHFLQAKAAPAEEGRLPAVGEMVLDRYLLQSSLGKGGFGAVYLARDLEADRDVALKILWSDHGPVSPADRDRFLRETNALSLIDDPHVVGIYDFGHEASLFYCAMELVEGQTVGQRVRERGACSPAEGVSLLTGLTRALAALERLALVHRDVKPENVVLRGGDYGEPVLVDFGLIKGGFDAGVTSPEVILGSPGYLAPESIDGLADHRSDLFSMGQVVAFALRGERAFPKLKGLYLLMRMAQRAAPIPDSLPSQLRQVLSELVAVDPAERPASATELLSRLAALQLGEAAARLTTPTDSASNPPGTPPRP